MANYIKVQDIFDSVEKYKEANILTLDIKNARDLKTRKSKTKTTSNYDVAYINILFNHVNGKSYPLKLEFDNVICYSKAKPHSKVVHDQISCVYISIVEMDRKDIEGGDYAPPTKENKEEQEKINKEYKNMIDTYYKSTKNFFKALLHINNSYVEQAKILSRKSKSDLGFNIKKTKTFVINDLVQTEYDDPESGEKIAMEKPIIRTKILLDPKTKIIGRKRWNKDTKKFDYVPFICDLRKTLKYKKPYIAKIKNGKKYVDLNLENIGTFITEKSMITGVLEFPEIVSSSQGISLSNSYLELYVLSHTIAKLEKAFNINKLESSIKKNNLIIKNIDEEDQGEENEEDEEENEEDEEENEEDKEDDAMGDTSDEEKNASNDEQSEDEQE